MSRIGFIGTGHIAAPMVRHLAAQGHEIIVTRRNETVSAVLARDVGVAVAEPQAVVDACDIVFLCLRPHIAEDVLSGLSFRAEQQIVSVMAAVPRDRLAAFCAPAADYVQTIPLGFLEQGGCPLAAYGNDRLLSDLFAPENPVVPVASEEALNAHFAICAMVPGVLDLMNSGADWLGAQTGDRQAAEFFTTQLLAGFLNSMKGSLAEERDALATDGTLSLQMTDGLRTGGAHEALTTTLAAIGARLEAK
ncbi:NAD(P)-binding domain-containing protein [Primorskyibacter aestuariivivens]|uniref:NAD(P)-binding domain-containing protein n=1 Tax=Primorskyibacter aestuariivivens TaxID=1888912 RepID=UPI00230194D8|nr:NAD(P)-binding domain-containing protein [Primorskyibacter aestuariivivens]MDA7428160.1 NAD(P)-binding domain-containing protein [Primorskyibacter aestuariivivens]